ncbi:hypothetical protein [Thermobrachium celere]|uniref:Uncharacterized protein n=1 Tax=Thermobrachium celere DSM 8682 TaxID=941824 RepID=R7RPN4_9CLOT|nr:hypothetical protein [Thermobrachium celere]GFR35939.1 hypothetical protein TCEA9_17510 [Thermobrachium celere]CDF57336.1 hypothetical protein TCEL_01250 [Thermobrachium celere DSM 8682]
MKRIYSYLVIVITGITLFVMFSLRSNEIQVTGKDVIEDEVKILQDEDTGYIFEDFNKGINIKLEENKEENKNDNKQSFNNLYKLKYIYDNYIISEYYNIDVNKNFELSTSYKTYDLLSMENKISLDDKAFIFSLIKYLKPSDVLKLKDIIFDGVTEEEAQDIFDLFKERLPNETYDRLLNVVWKYEN